MTSIHPADALADLGAPPELVELTRAVAQPTFF